VQQLTLSLPKPACCDHRRCYYALLSRQASAVNVPPVAALQEPVALPQLRFVRRPVVHAALPLRLPVAPLAQPIPPSIAPSFHPLRSSRSGACSVQSDSRPKRLWRCITGAYHAAFRSSVHVSSTPVEGANNDVGYQLQTQVQKTEQHHSQCCVVHITESPASVPRTITPEVDSAAVAGPGTAAIAWTALPGCQRGP
jgi:hypothetical protein